MKVRSIEAAKCRSTGDAVAAAPDIAPCWSFAKGSETAMTDGAIDVVICCRHGAAGYIGTRKSRRDGRPC